MAQQTFTSMNATEKASLLHQWFFTDIPAFLAFATQQATDLMENCERHRDHWDRPTRFYDFDYWLSAAEVMKEGIDAHGVQLCTQQQLFAEVLFTMPAAVYTVNCLYDYAARTRGTNKLLEATRLFYF